MPGTDGQTRWLSADEQQAWRATVHLSQLLMRQLDRDLNVHGLNGHDYEILVELFRQRGELAKFSASVINRLVLANR